MLKTTQRYYYEKKMVKSKIPPESVTYSFEYQKEHFLAMLYTSSEVTSLYYKILLPLDVKPVSIKPELISGTNSFYTIYRYYS